MKKSKLTTFSDAIFSEVINFRFLIQLAKQLVADLWHFNTLMVHLS